ncbi:uncharacterized protein [Palaemon carinicauda]|uniref:uncharacterized protein n=1 Tax=Palaemon carinicauda TaxID=392227 RepID=UPI0035B61CB3
MNLRRGVKCLSDDRATEVTVPLLHRDCKSPAKKLTITVNRGDDVVIEFKNTLNLAQMTWRQDQDSKKPYEKINMTEESKLTVPHDKTKESGVYLFNIDNEEPGASRECAVVIIRRECPANRYGNQCSHWCPDCMHGGICDAKTGKCVCPPGLRGELCEEACEGDQILNSCTINPGVTSNIQICLPSPYGCSCAPGKKGYWCNADCDPGTWGVNCLQRCNHCVGGTCNKVTGKCSSGREDPCAGGPKGYLRFRQEPDVKPDEDHVTVSFVKEFDGEEPISNDIIYRVVIWEKDQSMNNMTTSKEKKDSIAATKMSVTIRGLTPATNYYAAVLVKFPLNDTVCEIDGTLRGERIQKKLFTTICPKGKISNIITDWKSQEGFSISWKEEAYAKRCNYTYEVKVERVSDGKEIYNNILKNHSHSQHGLETYAEYTVSITVVYGGGKSDPYTIRIKTLQKPPTTPPSPIRFFEDSGSVTYKWNRPSDVEGNISYRYTYEVKPIACGEATENPAVKETEDTEVSFPKPLPYARVTFRIAIGNEAGFSGYEEISHETDPEVPAIKVEKIDCGDYKSRKECRVTLENDCRKINGRDLDIEAVWEYKTNSARDHKSGNMHADSFVAQNIHDYIIEFPRDFYHHTTYQLAVYVKNEAGRNERSRYSSEKIITPPVAPGKVKITRNVRAHSSIDLGWDPAPSFPPTGDIKEYVINVYKTQDETLVGTFKTTKESYFIHDLDPDVSYTIHVSRINEGVEQPGEAAVTVIATVAQRPTTPPSLERIFEDSGSVTYKWNRPSDVEGNISYRYTYEVKPIACGEATENPAVKETEATEVSFPKPLPYARVTFRIAIGNEAGFSGYKEISHETDPEVPAIKVEKIDCGDYKSRKECRVTLENDCRKINGRDLDIEAVWEYKTNSARDHKSGNMHADSFVAQNIHDYIIEFPRDFYHHTTYQLAVYVKNEAGRNERSRYSSEKIITPPVAPGKVKITRNVRAHSSIDLGWDPAPSFPPTGDIKEYVINVYKTQDETLVGTFKTTKESYFIHDLDPDVSYTIHVSRINEGVEQPGEAAVTVIATVAQRPTTPPSLERIFEDSGSVTYKWNRPSDVEGNISYRYTYEVKPIACGEATENPAVKETEATEVSFPKPLPYARVTFRIAIGNEAGFSGYKEISHETDPEVPAIKVEKIDCGDYKSRKECRVTLENDCRKINGRDLDIEAVWEYKTNSARDHKSGNMHADSFVAQNIHDYIIEFPRDFYHHTTYQLAVYVKNEAGRNERSRYSSEKIITPPVAPGKVKITRNVRAHSSIDLGWDPAPSFPPTGDIKEYVINVYKTQDETLVGTFKTTKESYFIHDLDPDVSYTIHVSRINEGVEQPGEAAVTVIATVAQRPTTPPSLERIFEDSGSVTYKWNRPSDVEGNISYRYTYEVKPIACGEVTENPAVKETEATEVSFPKPLPYARVTFRIAIGNEAGFSGYQEISHETDPEVPAIKVEKIDCGDYKSRKECRVTLENDCRKINGRDLDIEAVWEYKTNSARDPKSGNMHADSFAAQNIHDYIIDFPRDFYHHTTYQLAVYVKNEAGTNESSRYSSEKIITPPVAPGKVKITRNVRAHNSIDLGWDPAPSFPPTGDIKEYVINVYKTQDETLVGTFKTTKESYFIHDLDPDVSYTIHVSRINEGVEQPGEAAVTVIATVAQRPTTPPSLERIFEDSGSVTYKWNRPSDVEGNISYKYTYEVKPIACGEVTENPAVKETQATEVSFPKPLPYARVTFRIAIGNEAGFSGYKEISHETNPEVPAIKVEKIDCGDYKSRKECRVTLENDCRKINGRDLDIEAVWEYKTNSARDPKSGNMHADSFAAQNIHDYIIDFPRDFYHHTTYQLAVYVKNEAGTNESSRYSSEKIITPPVAPGKVKITRNVRAHNSIDLGWDPAPSFPPTGDIKEYVINVYKTQDETLVSRINEGVEQPGEATVTVIATVAQSSTDDDI